MRVSEAFPSKYLASEDLQGRDVTVTISNVQKEEVGRQRDVRPVIYFMGKQKGMVLNKTNANAISGYYGDNMLAWVGKSITIGARMVEFEGKAKPGLRVVGSPPTAANTAPMPDHQAPPSYIPQQQHHQHPQHATPPLPPARLGNTDLDDDSIPF